jgi:hypothetical protein
MSEKSELNFDQNNLNNCEEVLNENCENERSEADLQKSELNSSNKLCNQNEPNDSEVLPIKSETQSCPKELELQYSNRLFNQNEPNKNYSYEVRTNIEPNENHYYVLPTNIETQSCPKKLDDVFSSGLHSKNELFNQNEPNDVFPTNIAPNENHSNLLPTNIENQSCPKELKDPCVQSDKNESKECENYNSSLRLKTEPSQSGNASLQNEIVITTQTDHNQSYQRHNHESDLSVSFQDRPKEIISTQSVVVDHCPESENCDSKDIKNVKPENCNLKDCKETKTTICDLKNIQKVEAENCETTLLKDSTRNETSLCDLKINGQSEPENCEIKDIETTNCDLKDIKDIGTTNCESKSNEQSELKNIDFKNIENVEPDGVVNDISFNLRGPQVGPASLSKSEIKLTGSSGIEVGLPGTEIRSTSLSTSFCRCQRFKSDLDENLQLNDSYSSAFSYQGEYQQNDSAFSYQVEYQDDDPVFFTTSYCPSPSIDNR